VDLSKEVSVNKEIFSISLSVGSLLVSMGVLYYAWRRVTRIDTQLRQMSAQKLTEFSRQENWVLFSNHDKLPVFLRSWQGLGESGWAWRVLLLNHLNLLRLAFKDFNRGSIDKEEFEAWIEKGKFWFERLRNDDDPEISEGRDVLKQLMKPEEGYSKKFCDWLKTEGIIP
jgi:hypothetical protein